MLLYCSSSTVLSSCVVNLQLAIYISAIAGIIPRYTDPEELFSKLSTCVFDDLTSRPGHRASNKVDLICTSNSSFPLPVAVEC